MERAAQEGRVTTSESLTPAAEAQPRPAPGDLPADLAQLVGSYAAWNPWVPEVRVRADAAGTGLVLLRPSRAVVSGWPFDRVGS